LTGILEKEICQPVHGNYYCSATLLFFFIMIFASSWLKPGNKLSWIWQLLTCVTMVCLLPVSFYTGDTKFPRMKAFDLPSQQQLNSFLEFWHHHFYRNCFSHHLWIWVPGIFICYIRKGSASLLKRSYRENFKAGNFLNEKDSRYDQQNFAG